MTTDKNTPMRLTKFLAQAGIASRRAAELLIEKGLVYLNGKKCLIPHTPVDPDRDSVVYQKKKVVIEHKEYYMLNKPKGYVCTSSPFGSKKRAVDLIPSQSRLFTVGRLDKDTSGLILLTNDGEFANRVTHPSREVQKEYLVKVNKEVLHEHLVAIAAGTIVEGKKVVPLSVKKVRRGTLKVVVLDGRKHEVRILCLDAGLEVVELKRIRIGSIVLGGLEEGAWKALTAKERNAFLEKNDVTKTDSDKSRVEKSNANKPRNSSRPENKK